MNSEMTHSTAGLFTGHDTPQTIAKLKRIIGFSFMM